MEGKGIASRIIGPFKPVSSNKTKVTQLCHDTLKKITWQSETIAHMIEDSHGLLPDVNDKIDLQPQALFRRLR